MKTFKLPFSETEIDVNNEGVITRVNGFDFICNILEMKLSEYRLMDLDNDGSHMFPYWLDMFIQEIGTSLPENNDDFEKIVRKNWEQWNTDEVLIGTQLDHYQFGDEHMAHDMKDYYGDLRANGDLFQRRWDFAIADIEVRIKSEQYV
jgi:hypothetical protein